MASAQTPAQAAAMVANAQGQLSANALRSSFSSLGTAEIIDWRLYDNQTIAAGTAVPASISLFQTAAGGVSSKTTVQTNMSGQGVLPASQAFVVTGLSLTYNPNCSFLDIVNFGINSFLEFQVSNKTYIQMPTIEVPGGSVPLRNAVANQGANEATNALLAGSTSAGIPVYDNVLKLRYPVPIWVQEQFIVTITTPGSAPTLISGTAAPPTYQLDSQGIGLNFWVNLHGILYRNVR